MIEIDTKYNWPKIGNEKAIAFLSSVLDNSSPASTYIFNGRGNLGKSTIALAFARNLQNLEKVKVEEEENETLNPDLHILERGPEEKSISIEAVREFIKTLSLGSFLNSYKIGIIKEASYLSEEAKSALLKTLEEPRSKVIMILLVDDISDLPATIISRAQVLYFEPVSSEIVYDYLIDNYGANRSQAKDLANLCLGRPLEAIAYLENPEKYKNYLGKAELWLDFCLAKNVNNRLEILDNLFKDKTWSKEARDSAESLIFLGEGLARDLMLLVLDQANLMQHLALSDKLITLKTNFNNSDEAIIQALNWLKLLAQAREYLEGSVNPRLVLEQVAINY
ncbi:hypothetical protein GW758_03370 [Candidatus Falkowbacteria bacterium]|nr:hypothetical protein [Candidatus Falkowbacteria bacterium]NCT54967.1 hypothetical protein [Candidatus Falkowbacteria bacterium]